MTHPNDFMEAENKNSQCSPCESTDMKLVEGAQVAGRCNAHTPKPFVKFGTRLLLIGFISIAALGQSRRICNADDFVGNVSPFLETYCVECHNGQVHKGDLDLTRYTTDRDITGAFRRWLNVVEFVKNGEMPPQDSKQPSLEERNALIASVERILLTEAAKNAGDPGIVLPRRLSNTEYDAAIRDLTGVEIQATRDFPTDPAGGEGFNNTGEALGTSPNLVKKYLAAAQLVSEHLVLKTDGISFAPFPVTSYNERKKLTEMEIIRFYERHHVLVEKYLDAAWRYRHRTTEVTSESIEDYAESIGLSGKYLALVSRTLSEASSKTGYMKQLGEAWDALPAPSDGMTVPSELHQLQKFVAVGRRIFAAPEGQLIHASAGNWPIGHLDMRAKVASGRDRFDRKVLKGEVLLDPVRIDEPKKDGVAKAYSAFLRVEPAFSEGESWVVIKRPLFSKANHLPNNAAEERQHEIQSLRSVLERTNPALAESLGFGKHPAGGDLDPDSFVVRAPTLIEFPFTPELQRELNGKHLLFKCELDRESNPNGSAFVLSAKGELPKERFDGNARLLMLDTGPLADAFDDSNRLFCEAFPSRFFYVDEVRGLAAGFHLVEGFFRDDQPLVQKVLSQREIAELDGLWRELDFVTESAENLLRGFVWFERSEREVLLDKRFDFLRSEDPELIEDALLTRFEREYLEKLGVKLKDGSLEAIAPDAKYAMIHGFFQSIREGLSRQKELLRIAEEKALNDIRSIASRAYRRPVSDTEYNALITLYGKLRKDGQSVEASLRGLLIAILMSPNYCYLQFTPPVSDGIVPLGDHDLASRLSFFLWSSIPDAELLEVANSDLLDSDAALRVQVRRMLKDAKVEAFAREFVGQWLRYRDYLEKDPILADAFPGYDDELRKAIFEEPTHLVKHLIQTDQPISELIASDVTFLNRPLAKHYGGELERSYRRAAKGEGDLNWYPIAGLRNEGRGGLLGMAVTLTKNSAGERTSPVKRGFWSVHHLLGQHFPPPPADVPELPRSEKLASATIRELLAAHVAQPQCALCHSHFDGLGVAMEGFDAIGRARTTDNAGRPIDPVAIMRDGETVAGVPGLVDYIVQKRKEDFVRTLCRKFLGYALGRSVELSDQPLLQKMEKSLLENQLKFSVLFEEVVLSPQFRNQRGLGKAAGGS